MANKSRKDELYRSMNKILDIVCDNETEKQHFDILASKHETSRENVAIAAMLTGGRLAFVNGDTRQAFERFLERVDWDFPPAKGEISA